MPAVANYRLMATRTGSVFVRKALGRQLKMLRLAAGKTFADVVEVGSPAKMRRIENGDPPIKMADVRTLCFMYGVDNSTTEQLVEMSLNKDADWWEYYSDVVPNWFGQYVALESASTSITTHSPELIHGLLQTPDYHRAIYLADEALAPEGMERQLSLRADRRRAAFDRTPPLQITAILSEAALLRAVGGAEAMRQQIAHLVHMDESEHVTIVVLPLAKGAHGGMATRFSILANDDPTDPDVVYLEALGGGQYFERPVIVERYRQNADVLLTQGVPLKEYVS